MIIVEIILIEKGHSSVRIEGYRHACEKEISYALFYPFFYTLL